MALSEVYGPDKMARAIEDAFEFAAFGSDFIANILEQRERLAPPAGPLHLTRSQDLLDVELAPADSSDRLLCRSSVFANVARPIIIVERFYPLPGQ